jgi:monofunctional biosynthetic peptidoglycan transglycosylase
MRRLLKWLALVVLAATLASVAPVLLFRSWAPPTSAFMLEARYQAWRAQERGYRTQYFWVDRARISPYAGLAVIASEDQQFPYHAGFDLQSIESAVEAHERGKRLRGASTISQQVAKNLFLWNGRSLLRKALEAWFTVLLESFWPKERILEVYLNIAEFGHGIFGVEAAARTYFHKPAAHLTSDEAALLAAVLPNPRLLRVERPSRYVESRREWILGQMRELGGRDYLKALERESKGSAPARAGTLGH